MPYPKISIITPSYNQGQFIEKTIQSVLNQNYPNLEYIIIDGGSTDNTLEIIKKYTKYIRYWISEPDNGQSHALNKGFEKVTGDIIGWINSDDWYEGAIFETISQNFIKEPSTNLLIGNCIIHNSNPAIETYVVKPANASFALMLRYWNSGFCPPQPSIFFRGEYLLNNRVDEQLTYAMDLDFWLTISRNCTFKYININLSNYLIHTNSKSGEGSGFQKFIPEWKRVCLKHVLKAPLNIKINFLYHLLRKNFIKFKISLISNKISDISSSIN